MPLSDIPASIELNDYDDRWEEPVDDGLMIWPASDLDYIVYLNPEHHPFPDIEAIERQILAEIAPRHRVVRFENLTPATLQHWSPFPTRAVEEDFLARGFGRGSVAGLFVQQGPAALRRRHDYLNHHQARVQSLEAARCLAYVTRSALISLHDLVPRARRPAWLRRPIAEILTPVCGKPSRAAGDEADTADIPLTSRDGLLLGCDTFTERQIVHPSIVTTPDTIERVGRRAMKAWCGRNHDEINAQVRRELQDPLRYFGHAFDPCAAALYLSQTVMELRVALAEVQRRLQANNPVFADMAQVDNHQDTTLRSKLYDSYGRNGAAYREPLIQPAPSALRRRLLTAFYGGMSLPYVMGFEQEYGALENLARWVGVLRRKGEGVMDWDLARDLRDIADENLLDLHHLLATPEGAEGERLLTDFLPASGWDALIEAADLIMAGAHKSFNVTYDLPDPMQPEISGRVLIPEGRVTIVGPFLMLPVCTANLWQNRARTIRARGLYLTDAG